MNGWLKDKMPEEVPKKDATEPVLPTEFFNRLADRLIASIQRACFLNKDVIVEKVPLDFFRNLFLRRPEQEKEFWVSLDNKVYVIDANFYLDVTRLVDEDRLPIDSGVKIGSRPENPKPFFQQLDECIEKITKINMPMKIVLVDDGTFEGDTITNVLDALADRGIIVDEVRLGICRAEGEQKITAWQWPKDADPMKAYRIGWVKTAGTCPVLWDWVCERDFFPGVPLCGRAVGRKTAQSLPPESILTSPGQKPVRVPYLSPQGREEWVSLTHGFRNFSQEAVDLTIELWGKMEEVLGRTILVRDIPTIPFWLYSKDSSVWGKCMEEPWLKVLRDYQNFI